MAIIYHTDNTGFTAVEIVFIIVAVMMLAVVLVMVLMLFILLLYYIFLVCGINLVSCKMVGMNEYRYRPVATEAN